MIIQHKKIGKKGMFFVEIDGHILAELVYSTSLNENMIIEHTEVSDELRGKNMGLQLVRTAVEFARKQGIKIRPLCTFAKSVIDKHEEFKDVLEG